MKRFRQKLEKLGLDKIGRKGSTSKVPESNANGEHYEIQPSSSSAEAEVAAAKRILNYPNSAPAIKEAATEQDNLAIQLLPGQTRGLRILKGPAQASLDVIFIHGLTGDSLRTWRHQPSGVYWPTDLLPQNFPEARILSFGYDTDVAKLLAGAVGQGTLRNHATALVCEYAAIRQQDTPRYSTETGKSF